MGSFIYIPTVVVQRPSVLVNPAITGNPYVGQLLTCSSGSWLGTGPFTYSYQWFRQNRTINGALTAITTNSPSNSTYTLLSADVNCIITCVVTATNAGGSEPQVSNEIYAYDEDFYAVILYANANSIAVPTILQQQHFSRMVKELKDNNMWSNMDRFYVMAQNGGSAFGLLNWRGPSAGTSLTLTSSTAPLNLPTFLSNNGYLLNGTNQWIISNFTPSVNGVNYTLNNAGRYMYVLTRAQSSGVNYIIDGNATQNNNYRSLRAAAQNDVKINGTGNLAVAINTSFTGYHAIIRSDSTTISNNVDTPTISTQTQASVSLPSEVQWIGRNGASYYPGYIGFYAIGGAIPAGDLLKHREIITKYITNL